MKGYVFPGQGSQKTGMGEEFFDKYPEILATAQDILGYSIKELCLEKSDKLNNTLYSQPAIFTVNALYYYENKEKIEKESAVYAGHSLGEYNALLAAKVFDFEEGLKIVKERAKIMHKNTGGSMLAVIGLQSDLLKEYIETLHCDSIEISNYNSPVQTVVAGRNEEIDRLAEDLGEKDIIAKKLAVSGAFHTSHFKEASKEFSDILKQHQFKKPQSVVISNVTGKPYSDDVIELLTKHLISPVKWVDTINYMFDNGCDEVTQIGYGKVLTRLTKQILTARDR